jgi:hypothetical protein
MRAAVAAAVGLLQLLALAPAVSPQELPGSLLSAVFTGSFPTAEIETLEKMLFQTYAAPPVPRFAVDTYRLRYYSTDFDGSSAIITAELFVPVAAEPSARLVLVFGSGTTGIADACAPSLEQWEVKHFGAGRVHGVGGLDGAARAGGAGALRVGPLRRVPGKSASLRPPAGAFRPARPHPR